MNPRYGSWNYCTHGLISLAFISGSIVLYASYLCLSLIYCLTHVECFRFFDLDTIIVAPKLYTTTAVHATTISSSSSILRKIGRIYRSLGFKQVCSWLSTWFRPASTCFRHAHASRKPGLQPGLQLARIMEYGLYCTTCQSPFHNTSHVAIRCWNRRPTVNLTAKFLRGQNYPVVVLEYIRSFVRSFIHSFIHSLNDLKQST